jgi:hypothetical protein
VKGFMEKFWREEKKGKDDFSALNIIGMSACYSPNPEAENGFDLPFDLETGEIRADIWARWLENDPARLVEKSVENLKSPETALHRRRNARRIRARFGARILSKKLKDSGVPHIHEEFDDGHMQISYRYNRSLELISNAIEV